VRRPLGQSHSASGSQPLTLIELSPFLQERAGWPPDIGALLILKGTEAVSEWGRELLEVLIERLRQWTDAFPRARRLVHQPAFGLGRPYWLAMPNLDLEEQIGVVTLQAPGDEQALLDTCADLWVKPLDVTRPLWRVWLLDGLADGTMAMLIRLHHSLADGAAALDSLIRLFEDGGVPASAVRQGPPTNDRQPVAEESTDSGPRSLRASRRLFSSIRQLSGMLSRPAPRSSLNRRVGRRRRFSVLRYDLDPIRRVAHRFDATINDVLLTAVAGGLHRLLTARAERTEGVTLRATIPIAGPVAPGSTQNATTAILAGLPIGELQPHQRLEMIAAETRRRKGEPVDFTGLGFLRSRLLMTVGTRLAAFQRLANVYVANLRGPAGPLYLGTARVCYVAPFVPLTGNLPVSVGALSCSGVFAITVVSDPVACGDAAVFLDGMRETLQDLLINALGDANRRGAHADQDHHPDDLANP
jgi:diacylglycerol O-acyltransferase / wax synthase